MRIPRTAVEWSHYFLETHLKEGDTAVDATAGNGHDAAFLARLVGERGHVHAFDIQDAAISATRRRLASLHLDGRVSLHLTGHENLSNHLPTEILGQIQAITFNLGYLPGNDKSIITRPSTTLAALRQALECLSPAGVLTTVVYPGHPGGDDEAAQVAAYLANLPRKWTVQHLRTANRPDRRPPECWVVTSAPSGLL